MTQYVSLPASFSDIDIVEDLDNIEVTEDNVNDIIYDKLLSTATHLSTASDDGILLMVDYTVTKMEPSLILRQILNLAIIRTQNCMTKNFTTH